MRTLKIQKRGEMDQTNVISLEEVRTLKKEFKNRDEYSRYLKTLSIEQLHYEHDYLVNEVAPEKEVDFFLKGETLLRELTERIDNPQKELVLSMRQNITSKLKL